MNARRPAPSGMRAMCVLVASQAAAQTPSGLPTTSPTITPKRIRAAPGADRSTFRPTPVAENAKSGRIR